MLRNDRGILSYKGGLLRLSLSLVLGSFNRLTFTFLLLLLRLSDSSFLFGLLLDLFLLRCGFSGGIFLIFGLIFRFLRGRHDDFLVDSRGFVSDHIVIVDIVDVDVVSGGLRRGLLNLGGLKELFKKRVDLAVEDFQR